MSLQHFQLAAFVGLCAAFSWPFYQVVAAAKARRCRLGRQKYELQSGMASHRQSLNHLRPQEP